MGAVKNYYHDEICGLSDDEPAMMPMTQAVREHLAREVGKAKWVADILDGKWDDTPAFRKIYGEIWLQRSNI
jgi:hypothetical protein